MFLWVCLFQMCWICWSSKNWPELNMQLFWELLMLDGGECKGVIPFLMEINWLIEDSSHRGRGIAAALRSLRRCSSFPLLALPLSNSNEFRLRYPSDLEAWSAAVGVVGQQGWHLWPGDEVRGGPHGRWASECLHSHWIWTVTDQLLSLKIQDAEIPYLRQQGDLLQCL